MAESADLSAWLVCCRAGFQVWGTGGRGFKSGRSDQRINNQSASPAPAPARRLRLTEPAGHASPCRRAGPQHPRIALLGRCPDPPARRSRRRCVAPLPRHDRHVRRRALSVPAGQPPGRQTSRSPLTPLPATRCEHFSCAKLPSAFDHAAQAMAGARQASKKSRLLNALWDRLAACNVIGAIWRGEFADRTRSADQYDRRQSRDHRA
jgi:hypothetical protein